MVVCPNCRLAKRRWGTTEGFKIGKKAYCCMGCGFMGCTCIEVKPRKRTSISLAKPTVRD